MAPVLVRPGFATAEGVAASVEGLRRLLEARAPGLEMKVLVGSRRDVVVGRSRDRAERERLRLVSSLPLGLVRVVGRERPIVWGLGVGGR